MSIHAPVSPSYGVDVDYLHQLISWLGDREWDASMLCTKVCTDYEQQQESQGTRFPVGSLMKHAYLVHSHMVRSGKAGGVKDLDQRSVWREVFGVANPYFAKKHPKFQELVEDPQAQAADFLAEFFKFAEDAKLTEKGIVVMLCTSVPAWSKQILD